MLSFKDAAIEILKRNNEPMTPSEITETALEEGLISTEGKTPEASMGAQLYMDIKNNKKSPFLKIGRGKFSLASTTGSPYSPLILIEKQNENVRKALKEELHKIDPFQFEHLIGDLLKKIGYENVIVTKERGDGGIDVVANLTIGGLTNVKTVVQVKRFKNNVDSKIIRELRGSAEVDQRGLVITTSDFTKDAITEAQGTNKMPVSLVNGEKLIDLLIEYGIGVKKEEKPIYTLDKDYFVNEIEVSDIVQPGSHSKNRSIWPLPGGTYLYVETLNKFLDAVVSGKNTKEKLSAWFKQTFETVTSEKVIGGYILVPKSMGLIKIINGKYQLTDSGDLYHKSHDLESLYNIICENIIAFSEIVEFLRNSDTPQTEKEVLAYLNDTLDIGWETYAQVNFRLLWLVNLKKIKKTDEGYTINL